MALADLQAFIIQCLGNVDSSLDLTPGSPYDVQVVQPILARLGTDPFTVDIGQFIQTLLNQNFPQMPTKEGDAITDLLIKAAIVLWNPIVREITRVANAQSFQDPTVLTTDEADALGANLFATRETGNLATGVVRIYFAQPQDISITPANFVTTQEGLHFYPTEVQGISVAEMLLNLEGTLYFFDINVVAEAAGDQYNIGPDDVVTIANVASATRITNKSRFSTGVDAETAVEFIDRVEQELTERSLVTVAGVVAQITNDFSDVTQINVRGFNDPEMQRDILTGGGLGPILGAGTLMSAQADGEDMVLTRRVHTTDPGIDFTQLIGPTQTPIKGFVLTLANAYPTFSVPLVRDINVIAVVDAQTLDLEDQFISYQAANCVWTLRAVSLSLSNIPGGILYPNQPDGTVTVPSNEIHIGGCTDVYVRASALDSDSLVLSDIVDDQPLLAGTKLAFEASDPPYPDNQVVQLLDFTMGVPGGYSENDPTWQAINDAPLYGYTLQILDPPNAGPYRILEVVQVNGSSPILVVSPAFTYLPGTFRWRISAEIFIDLVEPKDTKVSGSDMSSVLGQSTLTTNGGTDFQNYGVGVNDVVRITNGPVAGDYVVTAAPLAPFYTRLQVTPSLPASANDLSYYIFTPNPAGGLDLPFIRIDSIDLLDTSGQPVGTTIPYANPIDVESQGFANSAHGVKADIDDGILGIVSRPFPTGVTIVSGRNVLHIGWDGLSSPIIVTLTAGLLFIADVVNQVNSAAFLATGISRLAVVTPDGERMGILPIDTNTTVYAGVVGSALATLFGYDDGVTNYTSRDIRSGDPGASQIDTASSGGGWASLRPALDTVFDVAQVLDGNQIGFYDGLTVPNAPYNDTKYDPLRTKNDFSPEVSRHIQVGSRSLGTARCYFMDPTSFQVDSNTLFTYTALDGSEYNYIPDPTNNYQRIPSLPSGTQPTDGNVNGALPSDLYFESLSTDFIAQGIQKGDLLVIDYVPLLGTVALGNSVSMLATKIITLNVGGGVDKNIIFVNDSSSIPSTDVTTTGLVNQINEVVGQTVCSLSTGTPAYLEFQADVEIIVRGSSASNSANALLGFSLVAGVDQSNNSPIKGTYQIDMVGPAGDVHQVVIDPDAPAPYLTSFASTADDGQAIQQFQVLRAGVQRIVSTTMSTQVETANLYYFDVELISQGTGDSYNIGADLQMTVKGFQSDGYYLTTDDPNLTFSPVEKPKLHISTSILEVGTSDDPSNATLLPGQNLQVNYDRSNTVANVDNYIRSDTERVINESPLARHLIPYFVRFSLTYAGGSAESLLTSDIQTYINGLEPAQTLDASELNQLAYNRGAISIQNPITLLAVIHNFDRTITVERSQDSLNTGSLAAFIPDVLLVTRTLT